MTDQEHDGSKPLENSEQETFARLIVAGEPQPVAYSKAKGRRVKYATAAPAASRWVRVPAIRARLEFLRLESAQAQMLAPTATKTQPPDLQETQHAQTPQKPIPQPPPQPRSFAADTLTKEEILHHATQLLRSGSSSDAQAAATLLHRFAPEIAGDGDDTRRRPSPDAIVGYLARWSAAPAELDTIVARLAKAHTWAALVQAVRKGRRRERNRRISLDGNAPPSDTESDATQTTPEGGEGAARTRQDI